MMKCIRNFIKMPNNALIELYEARLAELNAAEESVRKMIIESRPSQRDSSAGDLIPDIANGTNAFAVGVANLRGSVQ